MRQVIPFNVNTAGTTKYLCLVNVRKGYGIGVKHAYALVDWNNNQQHRDRSFPADCSVPIYFNWTGTVEGVRKNWGHIAVRLADGRFWTDGKYYNSIKSMISNYLSSGNPSYLGWGESVNGVKVVENDIIQNMQKVELGTARILAEGILGRPAGPTHQGAGDGDLIKHHVGQDLSNGYINGLWQSAEARAAQKARGTYENFYKQWSSLVGDLSSRPTKAQYEELMAKLEAESAKVAKAEEKLAQEQAKRSEDTVLLDEAGDWLSKLFNRLFKR